MSDRLVADVPVGAFLSGGIDSAIIAALMAQRGGLVRTFTVGFEDAPAYNELHHARRIAKQYGAEYHEVMIGHEDAISFLEETLRDGAVPAKQIQGDAKDEGISASTLQRAKEKVGVVSRRQGFGGDGKWVWELPQTVTVTFKGGQADGGDA